MAMKFTKLGGRMKNRKTNKRGGGISLIRDKRGDLLSEYTLKVIIAAISLLLLLYLLFALYASFTNKQNFERAGATLENLNEKMVDARNLNVMQSIPLLEPNGWVLLSYISGEKPGECQENCICLCEGIRIRDRWKLWWTDSQVEKCNQRGVCKDYTEGLNKFEIELRKDVNVEFKGGQYVITEK